MESASVRAKSILVKPPSSLIPKKIPLFNGSTERELNNFLEYLEKLNYRTEKKLSFVGKIQIVKNKKTTLYFDSGEPPDYRLSRDYQSGPLSFEYFLDGIKTLYNSNGKYLFRNNRFQFLDIISITRTF